MHFIFSNGKSVTSVHICSENISVPYYSDEFRNLTNSVFVPYTLNFLDFDLSDILYIFKTKKKQ